MDGAENVWPKGMLGDSASGGGVETHRHFRGDPVGPEHVRDLLLRTVEGGRKASLRTVDLDGLPDKRPVPHTTSFLVERRETVNQKACVALHQPAGRFVSDMSAAENLRKYRQEAGLSQSRLAAMAGVSQQLISQIENGVNADTTKLPDIARVLKRRVEDIDPKYNVEVSDDPATEDVRRLNEVLPHLRDGDRRRVAAFAESLLRTTEENEQTE